MTGRYRHRVLLLAVAGNFSQFGARLALSPLLPFVLVEFDLTKTTAGFLLTAMWVVFAVVQYPSGVLADRFGERRVIVVSLSATAVCSLLLAATQEFAAFAAVAVLLGAGAGLYFSAGTSLLSRLFERRGTAFGVHSSGAPISGIVVPVAVSAIATRYGWQRGFLATAAVAAATAGLVAWLVRPTRPARPDLAIGDRFKPSRVRGLFERRLVLTSTGLAVVGMFAFQAFLSFFPTFLQEHHGLDPAPASLLFGVAFGLSALSLPLQGWLSDRLSRELVVAGAFLTSAAGLSIAVLATEPTGLVAGVAVLGGGLGWAGVIQSRVMASFAAGERGAGFGLVRTVFILLGSSGSAVTGALADVSGWAVAYGLVVALLVVTSVVLVVAGPLRGRPAS